MNAVISKIKCTKNNHYQIELTEKVQLRGDSPLARYNASDDRFKPAKDQYGWLTIQLEDFHRDFPVFNISEVKKLQPGDSYVLDIKNPRTPDGLELHLQICETTYGTEYQIANKAKSAKQLQIDINVAKSGNKFIASGHKNGMAVSDYILSHIDTVVDTTGFFVTERGEPIYRNAEIVFGKPNHVLVKDQIFVHHSELSWAENIDITQDNTRLSAEEEAAKRLAEEVKA